MRSDIGEPCNLKPEAKYKDNLEQRIFFSRPLEERSEEGNDEKDPAVDSYSKRGPTHRPPQERIICLLLSTSTQF